uniref:Uncharacterized protein n=1 Tax=Myoviridae sp. ctcyQ27 TaxID=2825139 RepID=A0A8S5UFA3_9CAUD|nr:MAG TPA: hypothetical protein [Myoviridae sp. ctcyQ27]
MSTMKCSFLLCMFRTYYRIRYRFSILITIIIYN